MVHPQEVPRASRSPQAVRLGVTGFKDTTKTPGGRDTHDSRDRHTRTSKLLKNQPQNQPHPPCTYSRARPHRQPRNARVITNHTTHPIKLSVVVTVVATAPRRGEQRGREPDRNGDGTPQCTGRRRGTWPQRPRISECVSRLPPVRLFTGTVPVCLFTGTIVPVQYGQSTVCENPKSLDAHTWIPPRSYYRRRSRVFWTTRSSCRLLLSMVRTPFERPDILFCRLPHTNLGREMNHLRQAARQRVPASKLVKSADPLELRSPADAVHFRVEEHLQEQLGATAIHRSPHGATKRHKLSP